MSRSVASGTYIDSAGAINSSWNKPPRGITPLGRVSIQDFTTDVEELVGIVDPEKSLPAIADMLCELGVASLALRGGFGSDIAPRKESVRAGKKIANKHRDSVFGVCGPTHQDIDRVIAMDVPRVVIQTSSNGVVLRYQKTNLKTMLEKVTDCVDYARSHGLSVTYMASDSTRSERGVISRVVASIQSAGCDGLILSDSLGCSTPAGISEHVKFVKKRTRLPMAVHCHNDYGLASANALAAIEAGAEFVHTCTGGVGERAGLAAIEEVATATEFLFGVRTGIKLELLTKTSRRISEMLHYPVSFKKPVTGLGAAGFQGGRLAARLEDLESSGARLLMMPYLPELVGNSVQLFLTDDADARSLTWRLGRLAGTTSSSIARVLRECSALALAQHRAVDDTQLLGILEEVSGHGAKGKKYHPPYMLRNKEAGPVTMSDGVTRRTLAEGKSMMLVEFVFNKNGAVALHSHFNDQIGYVASGNVNMTVGGEMHRLKAGDSYMIAGGVEHSTHALSKAILIDVFTPPRADYRHFSDPLPIPAATTNPRAEKVTRNRFRTQRR